MTDKLRARLLRQLAALDAEYKEKAAPIIAKIAEIDALKPPSPVIVPNDQAARIAQTLHSINTAPKTCLGCLTVRAASVYRCPNCGKISTLRS